MRSEDLQFDREAWIVDELTLLAVAFGESVTAERLGIYAADLSDINADALLRAFTLARKTLRFFPKISELRELAGVAGANTDDAEALAAWGWIDGYVRQHGVEGKIHYGPKLNGCEVCRGEGLFFVETTGVWKDRCECQPKTPAPNIPQRIAYTLELIGGIERLQSAVCARVGAANTRVPVPSQGIYPRISTRANCFAYSTAT